MAAPRTSPEIPLEMEVVRVAPVVIFQTLKPPLVDDSIFLPSDENEISVTSEWPDNS
jgi:hypothetical protein